MKSNKIKRSVIFQYRKLHDGLHDGLQLTFCKQYWLLSEFGLIKFITELQNFNLVQSRDRTDCQSIEPLANDQWTLSEPVVDSWSLFGNFVGYKRPFLWNQSKRRYISERRKNWLLNKIRFLTHLMIMKAIFLEGRNTNCLNEWNLTIPSFDHILPPFFHLSKDL